MRKSFIDIGYEQFIVLLRRKACYINLSSLLGFKIRLAWLFGFKIRLASLLGFQISLSSLFGFKISLASLFGFKIRLASLFGFQISLSSLFGFKISLASLFGFKISWRRYLGLKMAQDFSARKNLRPVAIWVNNQLGRRYQGKKWLGVVIWVTFIFEVLVHLFVISINLGRHVGVIMNRWILVEFRLLYKIVQDIYEVFPIERCKNQVLYSKINFHTKMH